MTADPADIAADAHERQRLIDAQLRDLWRALPPMGDWIQDAACARLGQHGADVFTVDVPEREELDLAKRVCAHCPVLKQCAQYAGDVGVFGLWAGTWRTEQRSLARNRLSAAAMPPTVKPDKRRAG